MPWRFCLFDQRIRKGNFKGNYGSLATEIWKYLTFVCLGVRYANYLVIFLFHLMLSGCRVWKPSLFCFLYDIIENKFFKLYVYAIHLILYWWNIKLCSTHNSETSCGCNMSFGGTWDFIQITGIQIQVSQALSQHYISSHWLLFTIINKK